MRTIFLLVVLMCFSVSEARAQIFDYVRIEYTSGWIVVSSTTAEPRVVTLSVPKGEENLIIRSAASRAKAFFDLVREYEEQGWEVFVVLNEPNEIWILRKPKQ